jgi:hypothetical protein
MGDEKDTGTALVPVTGRVVTTQQIEDAGLLMPLADPAALRAAFAERQRVLTSILDPDRDFVYSVRYHDREGNQRQLMVHTLAEANKQAAHLGGTWSAHPRKSGVLKLAHALGIESRQVEVTGLPKDQRATYSSCRYIATHKRTGRQEEGQGYCDATERGGKQKVHAIISMADTRAYCHAVLRCAGYDNVGAEELELDDGAGGVTIQNVMPGERDRPALSSQASPRSIVDAMAVTAPPVATEPVAAATVPAPPATAAKEPLPPEPPPEGLGKGDVITNAMAGELSQKLLAKLGSKDKARAWLKEHAGVERSIYVREDQIGSLTKALDALEAP